MRPTLFLTIVTTLALGACGGGSTEAEPVSGGPDTEGGEHQEGHAEGHGDEHPELPAEVSAFHEAFAPIWHADPGPDRTSLACEQVGSFGEHAAVVAAMAVPEAAADDEMAWGQATAGLTSSVEALAAGCGNGDTPDVEAELTGVHEGFHAVVELLGAER